MEGNVIIAMDAEKSKKIKGIPSNLMLCSTM